MTDSDSLSAKRVLRPVNLIPVGLKEAAWDSPSFRASVVHTSDQVDSIEKWLDSCGRASSRFAAESGTLENLLSSLISGTTPPNTLSEAVVDHDYSLVAARRFTEAVRESWNANIAELRKLESNIVEPLRHFAQKDLRAFKDCRRILEQSQRAFDQLQSRFSGQAKTKEPSSLREDAFQLHEARKLYLKASLDFAVALPQFKFSLDRLLARIFADQTQTIRNSRDAPSSVLTACASEINRIRSWSKELESGEKSFRKELQSTRSQIEESAELASKPSRELEDYATVSSNIKGPTTNLQAKSSVLVNGKQGWLNMKIFSGKQTRTIWIRRWFFVKNGVFGWLVQGSRSGGIEESERIGVLLCGVRPANFEERRFCFEVKTKDITIVLQADSQSDLGNWMSAFDIAKQRALEDPGSTATVASSTQTMDLAFSISAPSAIEFTASPADAGLTSEDTQDRSVSGSLNIPQDPTSPTHRGSFDVTAIRRSTGTGLDTGLPTIRGGRKASASPQVGSMGSPVEPSAGIAGLISASNLAFPLGAAAGTALQPVVSDINKPIACLNIKAPLSSVVKSLPKSSLAPSTFVTPPVSTNLSNITVLLNGEKGNVSSQMDLVKGTPSGMMANSWGSLNWAYNNILESQDMSNAKVANPGLSASPSKSPDDKENSVSGRIQSTSAATPRGHRKTVSLDGDAADLQRTIINSGAFPNYYPVLLKHHDAQFRVLFPDVKRYEKLVIVFRATWNPSNQGDFPGRIYVTAHNIYFYSNHLGLILTSTLPLTRISEITAAPGRECDYLFVHLKENENTDYTRITVKVFLEPLRLLQKRLNYLVQNENSEHPVNMEAIMRAMTVLEHPEQNDEKSPSVNSFEGLDGAEDFSYGEQNTGKDLRTRLRFDQDILGMGRSEDKEKFKLPSRPVSYTPNGMTTPVVEMNFKISPKALFHVLFGDKSAIWQILYHQRGAKNIKQHPWIKSEQGFFQRSFAFRVPHSTATGLSKDVEAKDTQIVDVYSEHLCYVVTERKSAWFLPLNNHFELVSKVVITHVSKSNCKLAIYTAVQWSRSSILRPLIDHEALTGLKLDALDLMDVVSEQVHRLGHQGQSKKTIQIFGQIGQDTQAIEFKGADSTSVPRVRHLSQRKSITRMFFNAYGSFIAGCVNVVLAQIIAIFDWFVKTFNANFWLVLFFALSLLLNAFFSSGFALSWWQDLQAGQYMQQLGITKDMTMTKAISLADLDLIVASEDPLEDNICYQTFKTASSSSSILSPVAQHPATLKLRRSQHRLGTYRHDLIVAMRVLNSIEREIIQSEWEYWLDDEAKKCSVARKLLLNKSTSDTKSGSTTRETNDTDAAAVAEKLKSYCSSCEQSRDMIRDMKRG